MKALILTEGGREIGLGHLARCTAVGQALVEAGASVRLLANADTSIADQIVQADGEIGDWLSDGCLRARALGDCDVALVDSYLAGEDIYSEVADSVAGAAFFDDDIRLPYPSGLVINGALGAATMEYPPTDGVTYLLGGQYAALRREFWDIPPRTAPNEIASVMITVGATDIRNLTATLLAAVADQYPQWRKHVVIGATFEDMAEIESCADERTEFVRGANAAAMRDIMLASDIAICGCGQTLCELAHAGTPAIGVLVADNQQAIADGWLNVGFMHYAGQWHDGRLRDKIQAAIKAMLPANIRAERTRAGREHADGQGARRIAERMMRAIDES